MNFKFSLINTSIPKIGAGVYNRTLFYIRIMNVYPIPQRNCDEYDESQPFSDTIIQPNVKISYNYTKKNFALCHQTDRYSTEKNQIKFGLFHVVVRPASKQMKMIFNTNNNLSKAKLHRRITFSL